MAAETGGDPAAGCSATPVARDVSIGTGPCILGVYRAKPARNLLGLEPCQQSISGAIVPAKVEIVTPRLHRVLCLVPTLLLAASGAQAVECTGNALNSGTVTVCRVDLLREQLQLFWRDDSGQPYGRFSALR